MYALPSLNAARMLKPQHYVVFVCLAIGFAVGLYKNVMPALIEKIALTQLKPEDASVVTFGGVAASATREGVSFRGHDVRRSYITGEYIVDFTGQVRLRDIHGYSKAANEWLIQSPKIGDEPIYLRPEAFAVFSLLIGLCAAFACTLVISPRIGLLAAATEREIENTRLRIVLESGLSADTVDVLTMTERSLQKASEQEPERVANAFATAWDMVMKNMGDKQRLQYREQHNFGAVPKGYEMQCREYIMRQMQSALPQSIVIPLQQTLQARQWQANRLRFFSGFRLYMSQYFAPRYANSVTGLAYGGAALLIVAIGLRGLRFLSAARPSWILAAISIEFAALFLLALTNFYAQESSSAEHSLKHIEDDMRKLATVVDTGNAEFIERSVQRAVEEYVAGPKVMEENFAKVISERVTAAFRK
jgi:hypothetical protein